ARDPTFLKSASNRPLERRHLCPVGVAKDILSLLWLPRSHLGRSIPGKRQMIPEKEQFLSKIMIQWNEPSLSVLCLPGFIRHYGQTVLLPIDVFKLKIGNLARPHAGIDHHADDRLLPRRKTVPETAQFQRSQGATAMAFFPETLDPNHRRL